jgi:hypothetical protein
MKNDQIFQYLLCERLLFECQILHEKIKDVILSKKDNIAQLQIKLKNIQKQFYIINTNCL